MLHSFVYTNIQLEMWLNKNEKQIPVSKSYRKKLITLLQ
jgi:hypothetical protein